MSTDSVNSLSRRSLLISIFLWYEIDEVVEEIEGLLELVLPGEVDLLLILSKLLISIALEAGVLAICEKVKLKAKVKRCLFAKYIMGATMQDSSKRERNDVYLFSFSFTFIFCLF